jgi:hypothetical protein
MSDVEATKPVVFVTGLHTELRSGRLTGFQFELHYAQNEAKLHILLAKPLTVELGVPETVRLHLQEMIDALERAAASSANLTLGQPPSKTQSK